MSSHPTVNVSEGDIAAGVPMYSREEALETFLRSVPDYVATVYVADNGPDQERSVYEREWAFQLEVLHLPHDCGIGRCRYEIVEACTEAYLWVGDSDMEFVWSGDLRRMRRVLKNNPDLGGIAGWLIEERAIRSGARNLKEYKNALIKAVDETPDVEQGELPFARFEFIPQCALFRTEVFDSYTYDPDVRSTEHADFFLGHKDTEWEFASTPAVVTYHHRNIDPEYRNSTRGGDHTDMNILQEKWGVHSVIPASRVDWAEREDRSLAERAFDVFRDATPPSVWIPVRQLAQKVIS